jgi:hypothetical protein
MNNPTFEILSDAGEVLTSSPLPDEALTEAREGDVKEFSLVAEVERDGRAATFRGRDADGRGNSRRGVTHGADAPRLHGAKARHGHHGARHGADGEVMKKFTIRGGK